MRSSSGLAPEPETGCRKPAARGLRGQVWAMDFTIGVVALSFILTLYLLMWNTVAMRWNAAGDHTRMEASAYFASESLLATSGEPGSWEMLPRIDGNVSAIGLVNGRNELNRMKLGKLEAENATAYYTVKARLGLQRYQFGLRVTDLDRNEIHYEFGRFSTGSLNNSLSFERFGMLDGEPVIVQMEVWGG